jgi:flagellum-specific peptidoglycan hydrolase FlgJ
MKAIAKTTTILILLIAPISICSNNILKHAPIVTKEAKYEEKEVVPEQCAEEDRILCHIEKNYKNAQETERQCGVPACISLAQSIFESGAGQSNLGKLNNLFGHRSYPRDERHYYKGEEVNGFRIYSSHAEAYEEHGRFYHFTRQWDSTEVKFVYPYQPLLGKHWKDWLKGGLNQYCGGDPNYSKKIAAIIKQYCLESYNLQQ